MKTSTIRKVLTVLMAAVLMGGCATTTHRTGTTLLMSDAELVEEVSHRLGSDDITERSNFGVTAQAGSVVLRGFVQSELVRQRAISIILGTQGVREVVDNTYP